MSEQIETKLFQTVGVQSLQLDTGLSALMFQLAINNRNKTPFLSFEVTESGEMLVTDGNDNEITTIKPMASGPIAIEEKMYITTEDHQGNLSFVLMLASEY